MLCLRLNDYISVLVGITESCNELTSPASCSCITIYTLTLVSIDQIFTCSSVLTWIGITFIDIWIMKILTVNNYPLCAHWFQYQRGNGPRNIFQHGENARLFYSIQTYAITRRLIKLIYLFMKSINHSTHYSDTVVLYSQPHTDIGIH